MSRSSAAGTLAYARDTRGPIGKARGFLIFLTGSLLLGGSVIFCNFLQMLTLLIRPFSSGVFRIANRKIAGTWWKACVIWMENVVRVKVDFTGDDLPPDENAIVFSNHQQMPDILVLMALAAPKGRLGDLKWFVKEVLKYVPGIGWGMLFLDCLFVKREWTADRQRIEATFKKYRDARIPFWLISFVESTRITPAKLAKAQEFARKRGLYIPQRVLVPRSRGFIASVEGLGELADSVYDVTIAFEGGIPSLYQYLAGVTPRVAVHVKRFLRAELPATEIGLADWLAKRFVEKDERLVQFQKSGSLEIR
ncbi:MAG: lysophospholipid acyltransferase family protein [Oligoflexia bacterium]|nr:lysophospholipid acyltransferase family protein [Oligoflexia bacterium]